MTDPNKLPKPLPINPADHGSVRSTLMGSPQDIIEPSTSLALTRPQTGNRDLAIPTEDAKALRESNERQFALFRELSEAGDTTVAERLGMALREDPALVTPGMLAALGGSPADQVETALIREASHGDRLAAVALEAKLRVMRAELAPAGSTPVERLLADRVTLCWLDTHLGDLRAIRANRNPAEASCRGLINSLEKRRSGAQRRYLSALRSLATVQAKAVPILAIAVKDSNVSVNGVALASLAVPSTSHGDQPSLDFHDGDPA